MKTWLLTTVLLLTTTAANAEVRTVTLQGTATVEATTQAVRFVFGCSTSAPGTTGTLQAELHLPNHDALRPRFDFDAFEGPDANAGRRTRLGATPDAASAAPPLAAAGWIAGGGDNAFAFGLSAAIRGDANGLRTLAARLQPLLEDGRLAWIQGNARRGGPPITATLQADPAVQAQVKDALAPCLATARR